MSRATLPQERYATPSHIASVVQCSGACHANTVDQSTDQHVDIGEDHIVLGTPRERGGCSGASPRELNKEMEGNMTVGADGGGELSGKIASAEVEGTFLLLEARESTAASGNRVEDSMCERQVSATVDLKKGPCIG